MHVCPLKSTHVEIDIQSIRYFFLVRKGRVDLNMLSRLNQIIVKTAYRYVCNVAFVGSIDVYRLDRQF